MRAFEPDFPQSRNPWDKNKHPENYEYIQSIIRKVDTELTGPPKYPEETKLEVYRLREQGYTLREIAQQTGVSKSTACLYLQNRQKTNKTLVKQPGTTKVVEAEYTINSVNVGKIQPKSKKARKAKTQ